MGFYVSLQEGHYAPLLGGKWGFVHIFDLLVSSEFEMLI
jgi:hypothetical protein